MRLLSLLLSILFISQGTMPACSHMQKPKSLCIPKSAEGVEREAVRILAAYVGGEVGAEISNSTNSKLDGLFKSNPSKKHSFLSNIFRLRFVTILIKKFLRVFIGDPGNISPKM